MENKVYQLLKDYFAGQPRVRMAFLFGSLAKGRARRDSDVDVGVYLEPGYTRQDISRMWNELEDLVETKVDLLVLNEADPSLAWAALRGKRLLVRDFGFYLQYMLDISREAEDFHEYILDWWRWRRKLRRTE
ncbi:nucleotidyltransferase domain-containing protein [Moorellaceae bacterium AZ2]